MLGTSYPLVNIFLSMLEFVLFFLWIWLAISVFSDIFRSHDLGGAAKMLWVVFVVLFPYLGVFAYLIFRGGSMHDRAAAHAALQGRAFSQYMHHAGGASSTADQLHKLADLRDRGMLTDTEFQSEKEKLLASSPA
jgi:Phospholipase_D-nuclease N-terminal/Short C-terminal domain